MPLLAALGPLLAVLGSLLAALGPLLAALGSLLAALGPLRGGQKRTKNNSKNRHLKKASKKDLEDHFLLVLRLPSAPRGGNTHIHISNCENEKRPNSLRGPGSIKNTHFYQNMHRARARSNKISTWQILSSGALVASLQVFAPRRLTRNSKPLSASSEPLSVKYAPRSGQSVKISTCRPFRLKFP